MDNQPWTEKIQPRKALKFHNYDLKKAIDEREEKTQTIIEIESELMERRNEYEII